MLAITHCREHEAPLKYRDRPALGCEACCAERVKRNKESFARSRAKRAVTQIQKLTPLESCLHCGESIQNDRLLGTVHSSNGKVACNVLDDSACDGSVCTCHDPGAWDTQRYRDGCSGCGCIWACAESDGVPVWRLDWRRGAASGTWYFATKTEALEAQRGLMREE